MLSARLPASTPARASGSRAFEHSPICRDRRSSYAYTTSLLSSGPFRLRLGLGRFDPEIVLGPVVSVLEHVANGFRGRRLRDLSAHGRGDGVKTVGFVFVNPERDLDCASSAHRARVYQTPTSIKRVIERKIR